MSEKVELDRRESPKYRLQIVKEKVECTMSKWIIQHLVYYVYNLVANWRRYIYNNSMNNWISSFYSILCCENVDFIRPGAGAI